MNEGWITRLPDDPRFVTYALRAWNRSRSSWVAAFLARGKHVFVRIAHEIGEGLDAYRSCSSASTFGACLAVSERHQRLRFKGCSVTAKQKLSGFAGSARLYVPSWSTKRRKRHCTLTRAHMCAAGRR